MDLALVLRAWRDQNSGTIDSRKALEAFVLQQQMATSGLPSSMNAGTNTDEMLSLAIQLERPDMTGGISDKGDSVNRGTNISNMHVATRGCGIMTPRWAESPIVWSNCDVSGSTTALQPKIVRLSQAETNQVGSDLASLNGLEQMHGRKDLNSALPLVANDTSQPMAQNKIVAATAAAGDSSGCESDRSAGRAHMHSDVTVAMETMVGEWRARMEGGEMKVPDSTRLHSVAALLP